jgi:hypothetical protein
MAQLSKTRSLVVSSSCKETSARRSTNF